MDTNMNGIGNNDVATLSLLGNTGYGAYANHGNFSYDGSVINANVKGNQEFFAAATERVIDNQKAAADMNTAIQDQIARTAAEFREADRFSGLTALLFNQFNQIDRRFADQALSAQECCCELKAGQASIIAKLDQQTAIANAVANAEQNIKLNQLLARGNGNGNG